jgi:endonuclease V-like protein UPF0215 family
MSEIPGQQIIAEQFNTVDDTQIKEPKMPVAVFIQESNDLFCMCRTIVKLLESKASTGRLQKGYLNILQP